MFGKKPELELPATVIGPETEIEGVLRTADDVQIAGRLCGAIESRATVTVQGGGVVLGDITGEAVAIGGHVEGSVVAQGRLLMMAGGYLKGEARYGTLEVERGGSIDGIARRLVPDGIAPMPQLPASSHPPPPVTQTYATPELLEIEAEADEVTASSAPPPPPPMLAAIGGGRP